MMNEYGKTFPAPSWQHANCSPTHSPLMQPASPYLMRPYQRPRKQSRERVRLAVALAAGQHVLRTGLPPRIGKDVGA